MSIRSVNFLDHKAKTIPVSIREAQEGDVSFIFSSWLKSFRTGLVCKKVENTVYFTEHHKLVERLLKRSTTLIASDPEDPATIYGYLCFERIEGLFVLHYVYVKHTFRAMGVMRQLMAATEQDFNTAGLFSHMTIIMERLSLKYNLLYHPYILINYNDLPAKSEAKEG